MKEFTITLTLTEEEINIIEKSIRMAMENMDNTLPHKKTKKEKETQVKYFILWKKILDETNKYLLKKIADKINKEQGE